MRVMEQKVVVKKEAGCETGWRGCGCSWGQASLGPIEAGVGGGRCGWLSFRLW
jgi:hypothetical protein